MSSLIFEFINLKILLMGRVVRPLTLAEINGGWDRGGATLNLGSSQIITEAYKVEVGVGVRKLITWIT